MQGRRVYPNTPDGSYQGLMERGDYGRNKDGDWWFCTPNGHHGTLNNTWRIVEHLDRTITVSPSIKVSNTKGECHWHGYLENGIWREVR